MDLDFNLQGAPNFRDVSCNVYATAQPKLNGLRTILSVLSCFPHAKVSQKACWISTREEAQVYLGGRPFVLRDGASPKDDVLLSDRTSSLEEIEDRLKQDILREASRMGGVILVHEEVAHGTAGDSQLVPTWIAADEVRTPRELFEMVKQEGYQVDVSLAC